MTAYSQNNQPSISLSASGDAETWIYHFVKLSGGAENFDLASGASNPAPIGVLYDNPRSGDVGNIVMGGRVKVYGDTTGGAIAIGDFITAGSDGQAVLAGGSAVMGQSLKALASGACVLIDFIWQPSITVADNTP
jgi:hypothetical protein